eukprot:176151-Amphidinium_carterae.1
MFVQSGMSRVDTICATIHVHNICFDVPLCYNGCYTLAIQCCAMRGSSVPSIPYRHRQNVTNNRCCSSYFTEGRNPSSNNLDLNADGHLFHPHLGLDGERSNLLKQVHAL